MIKCPCEECLKLAVCITKNEVCCSDLANYANSFVNETGLNFYWKIITSILPNLEYVYDDEYDATNYRGL